MPGYNALLRGSHGEEIGVSALGSALKLIDLAHAEIHEGHAFMLSDSATLNIAGTREIRFVTPNSMTEIHLALQVGTSLAATVALFETTTKAHVVGNVLTPVNRNRNAKDTSEAVACHTPSGAGDGTQIYAVSLGTAGALTGAGGSRREQSELILKRNTAYLLRVTSSANANAVSINFDWYEERTETYTTTSSTTSSTSSTSSTTTTTA